MKTKCGYVAIIGRPNVGKSTLLNKILGQKVTITSHKPQTTRHAILGIQTEKDVQTIYVDTPGLHRQTQHKMNRYMNKVALQTLEPVDVIGFVIDVAHWTDADEWILQKLKKIYSNHSAKSIEKPIILIVNKVDQIYPKEELLPRLVMLAEKMKFVAIIPLSAKTGDNIKELTTTIDNYLPENPFFFPEDQISDRNDRFLASEIIREKLTRYLHQELPYALTVEIEEFKEERKIIRISALIWLEKESQKAIVIGDKGAQLKIIGQRARVELEKLLGQKVFLQLWVKVKENWSDDLQALRGLGYGE